MNLKKLSLIILAKKEYQNLKFIIPRAKKLSKDVIVVDGHSNDGTKELCRKFNVRFYLDNNVGKGDAQRVGCKRAKNEFIIFIDGDGAHDLKDVKKIYTLLKKNIDLVICSRQTGGSYDLNFQDGFKSAIRASGVIFLVSLFNMLFKTTFTDILYSFKGISKKNFFLLKTKQNGFAIEIDILIRAIINKLKIKEIPSRENARIYGKSKLPTIVGFYFIFYIFYKSILR
ncbi:glycosyltransferase family 2 protein [Candidatus Pelagibacter sp.]|nr:glycosyltransferase family 2 protein [Candidatus Pelagibacter sp.]